MWSAKGEVTAMGLRIQRVTRVKVLSTLIAVFALVAQPLYGAISAQVASALVAEEPASSIYVSETGNDANTGTDAESAFATIQKALDTVAENGTVHVADGSYTGTAQFKKSGTKLIGTSGSRDTAQINVLPSSGQGGVYAEGLNDITIKNIAVYGTQSFTNGALVKLSNGKNGVIENITVKSRNVVTPGAERTNATGININSFSNVAISNVFVAEMGKDGISVVAQQNTTSHSSHDITIQGSAISGAQWSAIALGTRAKNSDNTYTNKNISNVIISNVSTQYGQRGIYVDGAGGTVTSPNSDRLVLDNVRVGQNTNEYINNEQAAAIDARTLQVNIGGGVVVPVSEMTQAQYETVTSFIKDKSFKNSSSANYGVVLLVDVKAPMISAKNTDGTLTSGGYTSKSDITPTWTTPVGSVAKYEYAYWNNIPGNAYNSESNAWKTDVAATERSGSFTEGEGAHYMKVRAYDAAGNASDWSNTFVINYDKTNPTSTNNLKQLVAGQIEIVQTVNDNQKATSGKLRIWKLDQSGVQDNSKYYASADLLANPSGAVNYVLDTTTKLHGDGKYIAKFTATDAAGNASVTQANFTVDNTKPTITIKTDASTGSGNVFSNVSFKLFDQYKINSITVNNSPEKVLTANQYGDANNIAVGKNGGVLGLNTITLKDLAGNSTMYEFYLDNVAPLVSFAYSNNNGNAVTKDDVTVTMTSNEPITTPTGWTKVNSNVFTKVHTANGKFTVSVSDIALNGATFSYEVKRIDRISPVINGVVEGGYYNSALTYSVIEQSIDRIVVKFNGEEKTYSQNAAPYTLSEDGMYTITVFDKAGNQTSVSFVIEKSKPVMLAKPIVTIDDTADDRTLTGTVSNFPDVKFIKLEINGSDRPDLIGSIVIDEDSMENGVAKWSLALPQALNAESYDVKLRAQNTRINSDNSDEFVKTVTFSGAQPVGGSGDDEETLSNGGASNSNQGSSPLLRVATPITGVLNPITAAVFGNAAGAITGATDADGQANAVVTPEVLGAQDTRQNVAQAANPVDASSEGWKVFGVAWYWYVVLAALAAGLWWLLAGLKRRNSDNPTL